MAGGLPGMGSHGLALQGLVPHSLTATRGRAEGKKGEGGAWGV